jgi:RNA polymerase sigma-70 factor (ECF subfamily)
MGHPVAFLHIVPEHVLRVFRTASVHRRSFQLSFAGVAALSQPKSDDTDHELINRVQLQDEKALGQLYDRHSRLVYSVALRLLRCPSTAEDVLQEVFMQIWRTPPQVREIDKSLRGWIAAVSRNRSLFILRNRANHPSVSIDDLDIPHSDDLEGSIERHEIYMKVSEIVQTLSPERKLVAEMYFQRGMTHSAIASSTGLPLGTIKSRIRSVLNLLRGNLKSRIAQPQVPDANVNR